MNRNFGRANTTTALLHRGQIFDRLQPARARVCVCLLCLCFGVCILCSGHLQSDYTHLCPLNSYKGSDAVTAHQLHLCFDSLFLFSAPFFLLWLYNLEVITALFPPLYAFVTLQITCCISRVFFRYPYCFKWQTQWEKNNLKHWFR